MNKFEVVTKSGKKIYVFDDVYDYAQRTKIYKYVINSRYQVGDCISDFLTNTRYGCSIPTSQIDATSLSTLNTYCNESFTYTTYTGTSTTQTL